MSLSEFLIMLISIPLAFVAIFASEVLLFIYLMMTSIEVDDGTD